MPEGTTRLSVELARINLAHNQRTELSQNGAIWNTGLELSNQVGLVINREEVGRAVLCSYEGRFAISVE